MHATVTTDTNVRLRLLKPDEIPLLEPLLSEFNDETESMIASPDRSHVFHTLSSIITAGIGCVIGMFKGERLIGAIAGVVHPNLWSGKLSANELFWFVSKPERKQGDLLLRRFENWATLQGAETVSMIALNNRAARVMDRFYRTCGYRQIETTYEKSLWQE